MIFEFETLKFSWFSHLLVWTWDIFKTFNFSTRHLNLEIFSFRSYLNWTLKFFENFQTQLTWTGLWKFVEIFSILFNWSWTLKFFEIFSNPVDLNWTLKIFWNFFKPELIEFELCFLNMFIHMFEFVYNYWTVLLYTNPTVLYLVDIPPSNV